MKNKKKTEVRTVTNFINSYKLVRFLKRALEFYLVNMPFCRRGRQFSEIDNWFQKATLIHIFVCCFLLSGLVRSGKSMNIQRQHKMPLSIVHSNLELHSSRNEDSDTSTLQTCISEVSKCYCLPTTMQVALFKGKRARWSSTLIFLLAIFFVKIPRESPSSRKAQSFT